jgi:HEPN domain-containing protein
MMNMMKKELRKKIQSAMEDARTSRARGNEGRARVSARRAAGFAISLAIPQRETDQSQTNAYKCLLWYQRQEEVPAYLRDAAKRLTARVLPSHQLPHSEDPLKDAEIIVEAMLGEDI